MPEEKTKFLTLLDRLLERLEEREQKEGMDADTSTPTRSENQYRTREAIAK